MEFQVGQRVVIVDTGAQYSTYSSWVKANAIQYLKQYENRDSSIDTSLVYAIVAKGEFVGGMIYLVQNCDNVYLIGERGIKEAKETMEFKVGDTVEVINASGDSDAIIGDRGRVLDISEYIDGTLVAVRTTDGREYSMYPKRFKLIKEEQSIPKFAVGSKVIVADGSYSMEFVDGKVADNNCAYSQEPCEVTAVNTQLPTWTGKYNDCGTNDTIVRRISDDRVFFVQQRFLKEYIVEPKFKRGDWVVHRTAGFYRVSSSEVKDHKVIYKITQYSSLFDKHNGSQVSEDEIKEAL